MMQNEMVKRYIYEVVRRVPQDSREEISMELQTLIEDMCADGEVPVEEVLQELGDPAEFAKRYRDEESYLVGPDYYEDYKWIMKIVLFGIGISSIVSGLVQGIMNSANIVTFIETFIRELFTVAFNGTCMAVGIVTIIFAILQHNKVLLNIRPDMKWSVKDLAKNMASVKSWTPDLLPPVPDKRAIISRGDSIFSIIFACILAVLLVCAPELFSFFQIENDVVVNVACAFNLDAWNVILPILLGTLLLGLVNEIVRLMIGYYCKPVMYSNIICNVLQAGAFAFLLKCVPVWNPEFAEKIKLANGLEQFGKGDVLRFWGSDAFNNVIILVFCAILVLEVAVTVYKTVRYNRG